MDSLALTPEHAAALQRYQELLERMPLLEEEKEQLLNHLLPMLNAKYLELVGENKVELLNYQLEAYMLRRKMEMIRAAINRGSPILIEVIDTLVEAEVKEQREKLEQEAQKYQQALQLVKAPALDKKDADELRQLYYRLARLLHPDMNPDLTVEQQALWLQVSEAYREGNLERMRGLMVLAESGQPIVATEVSSSVEELVRRANYLQMVIDANLEQIGRIKSSFPYTHLEQFDDTAWVAQQNSMIREAIASVLLEITTTKKLIDVLLADNGL
jgi:hypothetical protein